MPEPRKIFVLDTSVILYDSSTLNNFEEHDVAVPVTVLEELDQFKKGNGVINLHAREFVRQLDHLSQSHDLRSWIPLNGSGREPSWYSRSMAPPSSSSSSRMPL